jgi:spindle assembly abnormal protein 6
MTLTNESSRSKILQIQLTDDKDPFFYYQIDISEEDFCVLKQQQGLLVDFDKFALKFVDLLDHCVGSYREDNQKFIGQLVQDELNFGLFSVVESNSFKHINHLSLKFIQGNDATIKNYLAGVVKSLKNKKHDLETTLFSSEKVKHDFEKMSKEATLEIERLKLKHQEELSSLKLGHAKELGNEKERFAEDKDRSRIDFESKQRDSKYKFEQEVILNLFRLEI